MSYTHNVPLIFHVSAEGQCALPDVTPIQILFANNMRQLG